MGKNRLKLLPIIILGAFIIAPMSGFCEQQTTMRDVGQGIDDTVLATTVKLRILGEAGFQGFDITVLAHQGQVQLSGYVNTQEQADRAVELAQSVEGVTSVVNSLIVK